MLEVSYLISTATDAVTLNNYTFLGQLGFSAPAPQPEPQQQRKILRFPFTPKNATDGSAITPKSLSEFSAEVIELP